MPFLVDFTDATNEFQQFSHFGIKHIDDLPEEVLNAIGYVSMDWEILNISDWKSKKGKIKDIPAFSMFKCKNNLKVLVNFDN